LVNDDKIDTNYKHKHGIQMSKKPNNN